MKTYASIDYDHRPDTYWQDQEDALGALLRNVKGTQRRRMIRDYYEEGRIEELSEQLTEDTLSEEARDALSKIHPAFMGGEFLPDYLPGEVEIARIELKSTTADVISIRARRLGDRRIIYRIVDEYETEFHQACEESDRPLTLGELIDFIDGSEPPDLEGGLALCYSQMNAEGAGRAAMRHFTTVSSDIYPDLLEHYEAVYNEWVKEET